MIVAFITYYVHNKSHAYLSQGIK